MAGLTRVHEKGRGAGARQSRGYLAPDVTGFTHAGHHHAALASEYQPAGLGETVVDPFYQRIQCPRLGLDDRDAGRAQARIRVRTVFERRIVGGSTAARMYAGRLLECHQPLHCVSPTPAVGDAWAPPRRRCGLSVGVTRTGFQ